MACSLYHEGSCSPALSRIRIVRREELGLALPIVCMQCADAPCATVCPVQAIGRDSSSGALLVNADLCIGCWLCLEACPFAAISISPAGAAGRALICDLCGGDPRCVPFCGTGAISL
jgi:carbon-monoxide dehydrogenase iron sulfur subunit